MNQEKARQLVADAKKIARKADSWISLSNALTAPKDGLIATYFPDAKERQAFLQSSEYEQLNQLLVQTIKRRGLYPHPSGGSKASAQ
jgi:hypothetical protein